MVVNDVQPRDLHAASICGCERRDGFACADLCDGEMVAVIRDRPARCE